MMADWTDDKDLGSWDFTEQPDKWGYLNNKRWSNQADAIAFCQDHGLPLDLSGQHLPCGHWHKQYVSGPSREPIVAGPWVAAMSQSGTPYIYLYDIVYKAVIKIDTSANPVILAEVFPLDSAYDLDYDMGFGNPGTQRGGYCMDKSGDRLWYLFTEATGDRSDAELVEIDISGSEMSLVGKTSFPNLVPSEAWPGSVNERIYDGCSDNTHTYWCTGLVAGRVIKIQNSDHSIIDDHYFNYPIVSEIWTNQGIVSIDFYSDRLYWVYARCHYPDYCRHLIKSCTDLTEELDNVSCHWALQWQNMIRAHSGFVLHQRVYHPFSGYLMKRNIGTLDLDFPTSQIKQEYLQNIFGVRSGKLFTLMHASSVTHPGYLYCIDFSNMTEISKLDVSYYAGQKWPPGPYDWGWTSVSAMNQQTGTIIIVRYHNIELKNYVACFKADSSLDLICDEGLDYITIAGGGNEEMISDEPQVWTMPG